MGEFRLDRMKKFFDNNGGEALAQVAHRGGGCSIPGDIQDQTGPGSGQLDLALDVPAHCRAVGLDDLLRSLPIQMIL